VSEKPQRKRHTGRKTEAETAREREDEFINRGKEG